MNDMGVLGVLVWMLLAASPAHACDCSPSDAQAAERISATLDSWPSIYATYVRYGQCGDGVISEGFTESVVHLLASQWGSLREAQSLIAKDPLFQRFIVSHINPSADISELAVVAALASQQCPSSARLLCRQIREAALEQ